MMVALKFEGGVCSLTVEAESEQDKALLTAFGVHGEIEAQAEVRQDVYRDPVCARVVVKARDRNIEFVR